MKRGFFEGQDFKKGAFKALTPRYYPKKYRDYIKEETNLLKKKLKNSKRILEAGVGIGRLIPELSPLVKEFIGLDNASLMIKQSKEIAKNFANVKVFKSNLEKLDKKFSKNYFDNSLCVWNTLGNVKDEVKILKQLSYVTKKSIFITVYLKGTLKDRKNWYKTVGIRLKKVDEGNEIFYSESGLKSKSYNLGEMKEIARKARLKIKNNQVLGGVILWVELIKS